jgi:hypothetical protein
MEDQGTGEEVGGVETGSMNRGARIEMRVAGKIITVGGFYKRGCQEKTLRLIRRGKIFF